MSGMSDRELLGLAKTAGMAGVADSVIGTHDELFRFARLVAAHEREACAKLAQATVCDVHTPTGIKIYGARAAKAIRERKGHDQHPER